MCLGPLPVINKQYNVCIQYEHYKGIQLPEGVVEGSVEIVEEFTGSFSVGRDKKVSY